MEGPGRDDFASSTGQLYHLTPHSADHRQLIAIRLAQVSPLKSCGATFESFSLLFDADKSAGLLGQGTYELANDGIGVHPIFITPVLHAAGQADKHYYEAVFTRRKVG